MFGGTAFKARCTRAMDEQGSQVGIAALADAVQLGLAAGRILPRHQASPGREVAAVPELAGVANCGDDGSGRQRPNAVYGADPLAGLRAGHDRLETETPGWRR